MARARAMDQVGPVAQDIVYQRTDFVQISMPTKGVDSSSWICKRMLYQGQRDHRTDTGCVGCRPVDLCTLLRLGPPFDSKGVRLVSIDLASAIQTWDMAEIRLRKTWLVVRLPYSMWAPRSRADDWKVDISSDGSFSGCGRPKIGLGMIELQVQQVTELSHQLHPMFCCLNGGSSEFKVVHIGP